MKALNYVVIVKQSQIENITSSGLDITSESDKNEKYRKGTIVSFGELCPKVDGEDTIKIGDEFLFDNYK